MRQALDLTHYTLDSLLPLITEVALCRQTYAALAYHYKNNGDN